MGDLFHIEVAAYPEMHPQAKSATDDLKFFAQKVKAGANSSITQYFFNADAYFRFVEDVQKLGVDVPVVPGIMPITNSSQLIRFSDACGAEIPRWIRLRLESCNSKKYQILALFKEGSKSRVFNKDFARCFFYKRNILIFDLINSHIVE